MLITPIYTALLALMLIVLSLRVIMLRKKLRVAIGDGGRPNLQRAICAHSNFCQYVPITLLLLLGLEAQNLCVMKLHILAILFIIGRIIHAYGVSQVTEKLAFRLTGMGLTFLVLLLAAVGNLYLSMHVHF